MGVVAGFLVQNTLKYLLNFGKVTNYLGYNALEDFFPTWTMKPNSNCDDSFCKKRQREYSAEDEEKTEIIEEEQIVHDDNEWGISVVDESVNIEENLEVAKGIKLSYVKPDQDDPQEPTVSENQVSLEELMKQMKNL